MTERPENFKNFLTVAEVARELRVSMPTVYRLVATGELGSVRVRRSVRVSRPALEEYLRRPPGERASPSGFPLLRERVLAALAQAERPQNGPTLAPRCSSPFSSYFRQVLAELVAAGVVTHSADGYWLASRTPQVSGGLSGGLN